MLYTKVETGPCDCGDPGCECKEQGETRLPFLYTSRICCKKCFDEIWPDEPEWSKSGTVSFAEHEAAEAAA
ncbi:hypothetical protein LCGC14_1702290 [marine sediment metagenome]|uniref:Uncharacterized protein n=1 Tax=marine sediment metagenome TaxID=412755 RepID=A0A0F9HI30_9ZZZZ